MRLVSFNVNGLRSRLHQLEAVIARHRPELLGLQETKVEDEAFPRDAIRQLGYHVVHAGQRGHYGVALLSRAAPEAVCLGLPPAQPARDGPRYGFADQEEAAAALGERRLVGARIDTAGGPITVLNGYFPQGENRAHPRKFPNKRAFYDRLRALLEARHWPGEPLVVMGDMNVAPRDEDVGIGDANRRRWLREGKCCFLPEERAWLEALAAWGLTDAYPGHEAPGEADRYSWFDYRSKGFERDPPRGLRIDLLLLSEPLARRIRYAGIDYEIRGMEKPSDHCPVWVELET